MKIYQYPSVTLLSEVDTLPVSQSTITKSVTVGQIRAPRVDTVDSATTLTVDVTGVDHVAINPLAQNLTLTLTGGVPWQKYTVAIPQDTTGSRTVTLSGVTFASGDSYTATTTANKTDILAFMVGPTNTVHYCVGQKKSF